MNPEMSLNWDCINGRSSSSTEISVRTNKDEWRRIKDDCFSVDLKNQLTRNHKCLCNFHVFCERTQSIFLAVVSADQRKWSCLVENPFGDSETNAIQVELDFWISCLAFEKRRFISLTCDRNVVKRFLLESPLIDIASFFRFCLSHHLDWCPKQQCVRWVWRSSRPESDRHRRLRRWWEQPVRKRPESKVKCGIT